MTLDETRPSKLLLSSKLSDVGEQLLKAKILVKNKFKTKLIL